MSCNKLYPKRKSNRLKGYSYSQNGFYFLTVCTKGNKCILGKVVGDGDLDVPQMVLSEYGKIAEKYIQYAYNIWDYVEANPARWKKDCFYCD